MGNINLQTVAPPHPLRAAKCRTLGWQWAKERLPEGGRTDTNVSQFKGRKIAWFRASFLNEIYLWLHPTASNCSLLPYLRQSEASTYADYLEVLSVLLSIFSRLPFLSKNKKFRTKIWPVVWEGCEILSHTKKTNRLCNGLEGPGFESR
jgi:hypothetical protein